MATLTGMPTVIAIFCEKLNAQVNVTVTKWEADPSFDDVTHFWANDCPCGTEHIGFSRWGYAEVAAEVARQTSRDARA